jgi:Flp pilus assembly protein CpaB
VRIAPRAPIPPLPPAARRRRPSGATLVAGALALAGIAVLAGAGGTPAAETRVLVAARSLPAGTGLTAGDVRGAGISAGGALLATLVPARQEQLVLGSRLDAPLAQGEPLLRSLVGPGDPAAFTLTVGAEHALGGALRPGDRVSVLASFQAANGVVSAHVLARGLVVLAVGVPPSLGDPSQATIPVTVALPDPALATRLALANTAGHIDLLRDASAARSPAPAAGAPGSAA